MGYDCVFSFKNNRLYRQGRIAAPSVATFVLNNFKIKNASGGGSVQAQIVNLLN